MLLAAALIAGCGVGPLKQEPIEVSPKKLVYGWDRAEATNVRVGDITLRNATTETQMIGIHRIPAGILLLLGDLPLSDGVNLELAPGEELMLTAAASSCVTGVEIEFVHLSGNPRPEAPTHTVAIDTENAIAECGWSSQCCTEFEYLSLLGLPAEHTGALDLSVVKNGTGSQVMIAGEGKLCGYDLDEKTGFCVPDERNFTQVAATVDNKCVPPKLYCGTISETGADLWCMDLDGNLQHTNDIQYPLNIGGNDKGILHAADGRIWCWPGNALANGISMAAADDCATLVPIETINATNDVSGCWDSTVVDPKTNSVLAVCRDTGLYCHPGNEAPTTGMQRCYDDLDRLEDQRRLCINNDYCLMTGETSQVLVFGRGGDGELNEFASSFGAGGTVIDCDAAFEVKPEVSSFYLIVLGKLVVVDIDTEGNVTKTEHPLPAEADGDPIAVAGVAKGAAILYAEAIWRFVRPG